MGFEHNTSLSSGEIPLLRVTSPIRLLIAAFYALPKTNLLLPDSVMQWKDKDEASEVIDRHLRPVLEKWIGGNIPLKFSKSVKSICRTARPKEISKQSKRSAPREVRRSSRVV